MSTPRHSGTRSWWGDLRPLDFARSIKVKLAILVGATVTMAASITWFGLTNSFDVQVTFPLAIIISLVLTQLLARGMTSPLREMTAAAKAMAGGDYSQRVQATSKDEVGQLATAFNRMAEDLRETDTLRREMVANVSHELRTPVTALQAQLENIVDGVTEPDEPALTAALKQTERLGELVTYLLDLSRLEAGAAALDVTDVPLAEFLEHVADSARHVRPDKNLSFVVKVSPPLLSIRADEQRLHQVFANLAQNAVRHSPRGEEITFEAYAMPGAVVVDVIDRGPGIARGERERVFDRFARGNNPAQTGQIPTGGTGLGLSIVRWAVTLHGGTVEVADTPSGCTMRVTLPPRPTTVVAA
ncbi:MAG: HAMP domain-containing histidine kinase [Actinomycetota bacterium]|nr:HAMP domain-containing histidine kinase [Actinomycetota bacterium]